MAYLFGRPVVVEQSIDSNRKDCSPDVWAELRAMVKRGGGGYC